MWESFSWKRVREHLTNNSILNNNGNKYKICQLRKEENEFEKYMTEDGGLFIK